MQEHPEDMKSQIQQSDQAIVIAKPLAWSMLVALIAAAIGYGWIMGEQGQRNANISNALARHSAQIDGLDSRARALENASGVVQQRLMSIESGITRIERVLGGDER